MDIDDFFGKASIDTDYAIATTVDATRTAGATVLEAVDLSKFTDDTPVFFVTYQKTTDPVTDVVSVVNLVSWKGLVNVGANTITNLTLAPGYVDDGNEIGDFVECIPTSYWVNSLINGLFVGLNPDGTLKRSAIDTAASDEEVGLLSAVHRYTYSSPDIFIDGVDQNNGDNTVDWTKPAGLKFIEVEVVGGGGAGGGAAATGAGNCAPGGGGGGGGYSYKKIMADDLGTTEVVTVGAGGTAGSAGDVDGNAGRTSSFGTHLTATGGNGGAGAAQATITFIEQGGDGGVGASGDINLAGGDGGQSYRFVTRAVGGGGGASKYSFGTRGVGAGGGGGSTGVAGEVYGGGGTGGVNGESVAGAKAGGVGAPGIVIIREYY